MTELAPEHFEPRDFGREFFDGMKGPAAPEGTITDRWQKLQSERTLLDEREQAVIREALNDAEGVVAQAARALGIARTTFASRLEVLGMHPRRTKGGDAG